MSEPLLAGPLAAALRTSNPGYIDIIESRPFGNDAPDRPDDYDDLRDDILAALRSEPDVLAAMAEALWAVLGWTNQPGKRPSGLLQCDNDNPEWAVVSARVLDALLGPTIERGTGG